MGRKGRRCCRETRVASGTVRYLKIKLDSCGVLYTKTTNYFTLQSKELVFKPVMSSRCKIRQSTIAAEYPAGEYL